MQHATEASIAKAGVAVGGVAVGVSEPSDYVSYFDRIYDFYFFVISGDDLARMIGIGVGLLAASNIIYNITKDVIKRGQRKKSENQKEETIDE